MGDTDPFCVIGRNSVDFKFGLSGGEIGKHRIWKNGKEKKELNKLDEVLYVINLEILSDYSGNYYYSVQNGLNLEMFTTVDNSIYRKIQHENEKRDGSGTPKDYNEKIVPQSTKKMRQIIEKYDGSGTLIRDTILDESNWFYGQVNSRLYIYGTYGEADKALLKLVQQEYDSLSDTVLSSSQLKNNLLRAKKKLETNYGELVGQRDGLELLKEWYEGQGEIHIKAVNDFMNSKK